jgi:hypothetical protein
MATPAFAREAPRLDELAYRSWSSIEPGGRTVCSDGSPYRFHAKPGARDRLVIFFNGGGACWSAETCDPQAKRVRPIYVPSVAPPFNQPGVSGIFDDARADNPLRDWSMVVVTYCTGDVHIGTRRVTYALGKRKFAIEHKGAVNTKAVLDWTFRNFHAPGRVLVAGSSAGAIGAAFYAGTVVRQYKQAQVSVLADGAGAYRTPTVVTVFRNWGVNDVAPAWMRRRRSGPLNIEAFFKANAAAFPHMPQVQYNNAADAEQAAFLHLLGGGADVETSLRANLTELHDKAPGFRSYTAGGTVHTVLGRPELYACTVEGKPLSAWVADFAAGKPVSDIDCARDAAGCGAPSK